MELTMDMGNMARLGRFLERSGVVMFGERALFERRQYTGL